MGGAIAAEYPGDLRRHRVGVCESHPLVRRRFDVHLLSTRGEPMRSCLLVLLLTIAPAAAGGQEATDTFEVVFPANRAPHRSSSMFIEADALAAPPVSGPIELRRGSSLVAVFQSHQLLLIANRSAVGTRVFEVETQQGAYEISADRMQFTTQHGLIVFWVGEEVVATVSAGQVAFVADRSARVEAHPTHRSIPSRR